MTKSHVLLIIALLTLLCTACSKDEQYLSSANAPVLAFSTDTLAFDTLFCTAGSTTRQIKVYNASSQPVLLKSVTLREGRASRFRLNVDGDTSLVARDIEILADDSIFIFVEACIDPNNSLEPFILHDAILFAPQDCPQQQLPLSAWGRNAVYHVPTDTLVNISTGLPYTDRYGRPYAYSVIDCKNWDHSLPHIIVGYGVVDEDSVLNLAAGDELYFANDAVLWVFNGGTLTARGQEDRPVTFTSLRHDGYYSRLPGQWGHIWLGGISGGGSKPCVMDHVVIENSYYGIIADSCAYSDPTLTITNSEIMHIKVAGIMADYAYVVGEELLIADCGGATIYVPYGGRYSFNYLTSANYWSYSSRQTPSIILSNSYDYGTGVLQHELSEASFSNCIVYGNYYDSEMVLYVDESVPYNVTLTDCLVKGGAWDEDPMFVNTRAYDFSVADNSPARYIGYKHHRRRSLPPDTTPITPLFQPLSQQIINLQ